MTERLHNEKTGTRRYLSVTERRTDEQTDRQRIRQQYSALHNMHRSLETSICSYVWYE